MNIINTLLDLSASAKYFAPSAPILFDLKLSVVSVCKKLFNVTYCREKKIWWSEYFQYLNWFKCLSQIFCTFSTDFILVQLECG